MMPELVSLCFCFKRYSQCSWQPYCAYCFLTLVSSGVTEVAVDVERSNNLFHSNFGITLLSS